MRHEERSIEIWARLLEPECGPLLAALDAAQDLATLTRLRRQWPAEIVAAAAELVQARRAAADKFPDAQRLVADREGVEQATGATVARHKATRFAALAPQRIFDLCCGIGGDAMALQAVAPVTAVDLSPLRAWMAGRNAGCATRVADVTTLDLRGEALHVDPQRRARGRRAWRFADYRPGPPALRRLLEANRDTALKLGPGVDTESLPGEGAEIEFVSDGGALVQAILWCGHLARAPGCRTATMLPAGLSLCGPPGPPPPSGGDFQEFLHVADPSLERAGLLGVLCAGLPLAAPVPALGLLTSAAPVTSPWLRSHRILEQMPWRLRRVRAALERRGAGLITVKTRAAAVDPDVVQRALRGTGAAPFTVFVLRLGHSVQAFITQPA